MDEAEELERLSQEVHARSSAHTAQAERVNKLTDQLNEAKFVAATLANTLQDAKNALLRFAERSRIETVVERLGSVTPTKKRPPKPLQSLGRCDANAGPRRDVTVVEAAQGRWYAICAACNSSARYNPQLECFYPHDQYWGG